MKIHKPIKPVDLFLFSTLSFIVANNLYLFIDWSLPAALLDITGYVLFVWGLVIISRN